MIYLRRQAKPVPYHVYFASYVSPPFAQADMRLAKTDSKTDCKTDYNAIEIALIRIEANFGLLCWG